MTCNEIRNLLTAYVDGELDFVRHLEIERHVEACGACAAQLGREQELHKAFGDPLLYHRAPAALRERIRETLPSRRQRSSRMKPAVWVALAASVLLAVGLGTWLMVRGLTPMPGEPQLAQAVVSSHIRSLMPGHRPDVVSTDRHTVKPWFAGKLKFSPPVKDLADKGFPLTGGSSDYIDGHEAAVLVYMRHKHVINLLLWPAATERDRPIQALSLSGYHVLHWTGGGFSYWAVSDLNEAELREFAGLVRE